MVLLELTYTSVNLVMQDISARGLTVGADRKYGDNKFFGTLDRVYKTR